MLQINPTPNINALKNPTPNDNSAAAYWNPVNMPIDALFPSDWLIGLIGLLIAQKGLTIVNPEIHLELEPFYLAAC